MGKLEDCEMSAYILAYQNSGLIAPTNQHNTVNKIFYQPTNQLTYQSP